MYTEAVIAMAIVLNVGMVCDLISGRIKNSICLIGLFIGSLCRLLPIFEIAAGGNSIRGELFQFLGGIILPFLLLYPLYLFGGIGAGDVKLCMAVGSLIGWANIPRFLIMALLFGAVFSVVQMLTQGSAAERFVYLASYLKQAVLTQSIPHYGQSFSDHRAVIHMAAPITFAALITFFGGMTV